MEFDLSHPWSLLLAESTLQKAYASNWHTLISIPYGMSHQLSHLARHHCIPSALQGPPTWFLLSSVSFFSQRCCPKAQSLFLLSGHEVLYVLQWYRTPSMYLNIGHHSCSTVCYFAWFFSLWRKTSSVSFGCNAHWLYYHKLLIAEVWSFTAPIYRLYFKVQYKFALAADIYQMVFRQEFKHILSTEGHNCRLFSV